MQRYLRVLRGDPDQRFALDRLFALYRERDGRLDELAEEVEKLRASEGDSYALWMLSGHVERERRATEAASEAYKQAASLAPERAAPLRALAELARQGGEAERAHELLEQALSHASDKDEKSDLLRTLAELALDRQDFDAAEGFYGELDALLPDSVYQATEFARALSERNQPARAVEAYQKALAGLRGDNRVLPPVLLELARAQLAASDVEAALQTLQRARKLAGNSAGISYEIDEVMVDAYRRAGRLHELLERLSRAGRGHQSLDLLGRVAEELGDHEAALDAYRRALSKRPRDIDTRQRLIRLLSRQGRLQEAIAEYRRLIELAPREPKFLIELAQLLLESGKRKEALALLARRSQRFGRDARLHRSLFELYSRWDEHELARKELQLLARIEPGDPTHLITLGEQQLEQGKRAEALATWRKILKGGGDRAQAHERLATTYLDHAMPERALAEYQAAVKLDPDELDYVRGLAETLERLHRYRDAAEQWEKVLELSYDDRVMRREARRRVVRLWAQTGDIDAKVREFESAFGFSLGENEPAGDASSTRDVEAGRFLAECYQALGSGRKRRPDPRYLDAAGKVLALVVELEPGDVESMLALERLRVLTGDLAGAVAVLERLVEADPKNARSYLTRMAQHALTLYRDDAAVGYAERLVALNPDDASAHRRLGDLYRARQQIDRAITSYARAIELDERAYPAYFTLAELHGARGEHDKAERLLRQVMRACPDDELVKRATRALIQQHLGSSELADLEQELLPLSLGHPQRPVYRRLLVELYDAQSRHLIERSRLPGQQGEAARGKLRAIGRRAIKPLLEALSDDDPSQRRIAIDLLGYLENDHAALPLLAVAEADGDTLLRRQALIAAGSVAGEALATRVAALTRVPERRLWGAAAWSLARMGGSAALRELRELVRHSMAGVRGHAVLGLGYQRDRASLPLLRELLRRDRAPFVRAAAAIALGLCGDGAAASSLTATLRSQASELSSAALVGLVVLGDETAVPVLAEGLFSTNVRLRSSALWGLSHLAAGDGASVRPFPPEPLQGNEIEALVDLWISEPAPQSGRALAAIYATELRAAASAALHGPAASIEVTLSVLSGELEALSPAGDTAALRALAGQLLDALVPLVEHPSVGVRAATVKLLGVLSQPAALQATVAALTDDEPDVRMTALAALRPPHAANALERVGAIASGDSSWWMRLRAVEALARLADARGAQHLSAVLASDRYAYVREAAASGLGRIGTADHVEALARAARRDPERRVRVAAAGALQRLGGSRARRVLETLPPEARSGPQTE